MHELSLIESVLKISEESARQAGIVKINKMKLKIGRLRQVDPDAMRFAFNVARENTLASQAELVMEFIEVVAKCNACGCRFGVEELTFICPGCGAADISVDTGKELIIESIEGDEGGN